MKDGTEESIGNSIESKRSEEEEIKDGRKESICNSTESKQSEDLERVKDAPKRKPKKAPNAAPTSLGNDSTARIYVSEDERCHPSYSSTYTQYKQEPKDALAERIDNDIESKLSEVFGKIKEIEERMVAYEKHSTQNRPMQRTTEVEDIDLDKVSFGCDEGFGEESILDTYKSDKASTSKSASGMDEIIPPDEITHVPEDSYAFIYLCGPRDNFFGFFFGILVFIFQISLLLLLLLSIVAPEFDTKGAVAIGEGSASDIFPADVDGFVRISQLLSIVVYVFFSDESMKDMIIAVNMYPISLKYAQKGDRVYNLILTSTLRLIQGLLAAVATFFLVLTSITTRDVILNFAAIHFVSGLDAIAFHWAKKGYYLSKGLQQKARDASSIRLPTWIAGRKYPFLQNVVGLFVFVGMMGGAIYVNAKQINGDFFAAGKFRVEFEGSPSDIQVTSGCYVTKKKSEISMLSTSSLFHRQYGSSNDGSSKPMFKYCRGQRHWSLIRDSEAGECNESNILAHSSRTTDFEIRNTFGDAWFTAKGSPLTVNFITSGNGTLDNGCDAKLGNGICDDVLNTEDFNWDEGDCCAATCNAAECGFNSLSKAFNTPLNIPGNGYQKCVDPQMVSIKILLTTENVDEYQSYFISLDCEGTNHFMITLEKDVSNQTEAIKVEDGAICTFTARALSFGIALEYTIYYDQEPTSNNVASVEIVSGNGTRRNNIFQEFQLVPKCYLNQLSKFIDMNTIYTERATPQRIAIDLLANETKTNAKHSLCDNPYFLERFYLFFLYLSLSVSNWNEGGYTNITTGIKEADLFDTKRFQCGWKTVT